jgi:hypothetical protein
MYFIFVCVCGSSQNLYRKYSMLSGNRMCIKSAAVECTYPIVRYSHRAFSYILGDLYLNCTYVYLFWRTPCGWHSGAETYSFLIIITNCILWFAFCCVVLIAYSECTYPVELRGSYKEWGYGMNWVSVLYSIVKVLWCICHHFQCRDCLPFRRLDEYE